MDPRSADPQQSDNDALSSALLKELHRVYDRIERNSDNTLSVIQYIVLIFGASVVAAAKVPEAFIAVPIFWTAWLIHSVVVDINTIKFSVYARNLEKQVNLVLGAPVVFWESRMAERGNHRPFVFDLNYGYWALLNGSAWIGGIVILIHRHRPVWAAALGCLWVLLWGPLIRHYRDREVMIERLTEELADEGSNETSYRLSSSGDTIKTHIPVLIGSLIVVSGAIVFSVVLQDRRTMIFVAAWLCAAIPLLAWLDISRPSLAYPRSD